MKLPHYLRPAPEPVAVTIDVNTAAFTAALARAALHANDLARSMRQIGEAFAQAGPNLEALKRRLEVLRAGEDARWYVRGGLDPAYATPAARDTQVQAMAQHGEAAHVAAFLRGWVEHRPDPDPVCACWWTNPSTWLSAASMGYGSGYEPGSQMEWNPDCPMHHRSALPWHRQIGTHHIVVTQEPAP